MQDYKLLQFKTSDFQDQHGNTWCDVAFEGVSEPVKWVVKDVTKPKVGETYYGEIVQKTSKADKPYQRFYVRQKPEQSNEKKDEYWEDKNLSIRAQWAIGQAVSATELKADQDGYDTDVQDLAGRFFTMVDRVKAVGEEVPKENPEPKDKVIIPNDDPINLDDIPF